MSRKPMRPALLPRYLHRASLPAALAFAWMLATAVPALAGEAKVESGVLSYVAAQDETNDVVIAGPTSEDPDHFQVAEYGESWEGDYRPISAGSDCQLGESEGEVLCATTGVSKIELRLGNDADSGSVGGGSLAGITDVQVFGGTGSDDISADGVTGGTTVKLFGEDQGDSLVGSSLADELYGGGGPDNLRGAGGGDRLFGGAGNDLLGNDRYFWGLGDPGPDVMSGGPGIDRADYSHRRTQTITATLDNIANDGVANEGDNIKPGTENIYGGQGTSRLTGDSGPNLLSADGTGTLRGAGGNDRLGGGDAFWGGSHSFRGKLYGGSGKDVLQAGDGGGSLLSGGGQDDRLFAYQKCQGKDTVQGGTGFDTAQLNYNDVFSGVERRSYPNLACSGV